MLTYLEEIVNERDPTNDLRGEQHLLLQQSLEMITDDRLLKVVCLLSEATIQIKECPVNEQVLCTQVLHNVIINISTYTEPSVAAIFERDLYNHEQH